MKDFPSDDPSKDTEKYIEILEEQIRLCPEQYYWMHRKYKNLPQDYQNYYDDLKSWE
jgi:KDO2-lipid IV(A) lauroyltransferase